jgi:hypothetical protein
VSGNPWVGQEPIGKDSPHRVRISPFFYSQHKLLNVLYIPKLRDLPQEGMDFKAVVFDFGFAQGAGLGPFETQHINLQVERPYMIWGIAGLTSDLTNPAVGFKIQFFHTHGGSQRQFFNKHMNDLNICGQAGRPLIVRSPYLVLKGDQISCEVKNLSNNSANPGFPAVGSNAKVQVVLYGGEFD